MAVQPDPQALRLGSILVIQNGEPSSPLPLEQTAVSGQIIGPVVRVRVTQQFGNPFRMPIELEYLFPLPHKAAIVDYRVRIGTREIRAEIKEREAARRIYQEAVDAGQRASLLEQRRPNLFSIQIGNVQPHETILCELEYEERLIFEDGTYQFVFPMGITPRYHSPLQSSATASSADSPLARPGERIAPVELQLSIDAGTPIMDPTSPSHTLQITRQDAQHLTVALAGENLPNKDFVLRYAVSGEALASASWLTTAGESEIALITLIPPRLTLDGDPAPREFVFVIDRSGSMSTAPMTQAKNALRACLRGLNAHDTFTIQAFDDQIEWFAQPAQAVIQENIDLADQWLDTIASRGGTEILPAIDAALGLATDPERQRYVVFLTDGSVSADEQAIRKIARQRGSARLFTFGIGPSVNRFLLDKIAQMGRGSAEFVGVYEDIETAITRFQDRVSYPALQDIQLNWQDAAAWDTYPEIVPDLYVGQPLEIVTRLKRSGDAWLHVMGQVRGTPVTVALPLAPAAAENPTIQRLWARARIEALLDQQRESGDQDSLRQQIISISLEHRLLTAYTAFVAVDSEVTRGGDAKPIRVSTPLPDGLNYEGFVGPQSLSVGGLVTTDWLGTLGFSGSSPAPSMQSVPTSLRKRRTPPDDNRFQSYEEARPSRFSRPLNDEDSGATSEAEDSVADASLVTSWGGTRKAEAEAIPEQTFDFASIDERIKWLARTQKVNGSWDGDVEMTAAALLSFVRAGHTTRSGSYRQQVRKAANWLQRSRAGANGFAAWAAARALRELEAATGDDIFPSPPLPTPTTDPERAAAGGSSLSVPTAVASLDDLRIVALAVGAAQASAELNHEAPQPLVQCWLALGKPL
jgi:Ca-activated chloride channel family protein